MTDDDTMATHFDQAIELLTEWRDANYEDWVGVDRKNICYLLDGIAALRKHGPQTSAPAIASSQNNAGMMPPETAHDAGAETETTVNVTGHQIDLSDGRAVWAGQCDDSWFFRFIAKDRTETMLRLSLEAATALTRLVDMKHEPITLVARYVEKAIGAAKAQYQWRVVSEGKVYNKTEDAPPPPPNDDTGHR